MQVYFTANVKEKFGTQTGVHLMDGARLKWVPLNTGFTVFVRF